MKPSEGGSPKSAVAADAPAAECRVPAPHPLAGCTTPCSCRCCSCARGRPDSGEQRPSRSSRPSRQRGLRDQRRAGLLALTYVLLLGGSLAAAVPARTASRTSPTTTSSPRRYPWTYDSPQSVAAPPPPPARGQQRRPPPPPAPPPDRPRPRPRPTATMPTPQQSPQPVAAPAAQGRGFSQSSLTGGSTGVGQRRRGNGGGAWCASEDAGARAYAATTVFEGKARSRSPAGPGGAYFVTFVVQHVYKDATSGAVGAGAVAAPPLRMRAQVRLQFVEPPSAATPGAGPGPRQPARPRHAAHAKQCEDLSRLAPSPAGPAATAAVRASIRPGGKFVVFADRVGPHNFTVRGAPLARSRATVHAIRAVLCPNCVKPPAVWGLRDISLRAERRLRLVCRTQGTPPPAVMWYKDGTRITPSARVRIQHNRKKSALVIARVRPSDGGRYECKAVSVMGRQDSASAAVSVQEDTRQDNTTTLWPLIGGRCFFEAYCLNGGTCTYYETVGELVCQCAEGYKGQRCENKDVINRGSMYRPLSYFCKLGISNSYYC